MTKCIVTRFQDASIRALLHVTTLWHKHKKPRVYSLFLCGVQKRLYEVACLLHRFWRSDLQQGICDCFLQYLLIMINIKCYRLLSIIIDCSLVSIIIDQDWLLYINTYYHGCDTTHYCLLWRQRQQAPSKRQHYVQDYTASRSHCRPVTIHTTTFPMYQSHQRFNWLFYVSSNALPQPAVSVSTTQ
jgi:hypothetical protein